MVPFVRWFSVNLFCEKCSQRRILSTGYVNRSLVRTPGSGNSDSKFIEINHLARPAVLNLLNNFSSVCFATVNPYKMSLLLYKGRHLFIVILQESFFSLPVAKDSPLESYNFGFAFQRVQRTALRYDS